MPRLRKAGARDVTIQQLASMGKADENNEIKSR